MIEPLIWNKIKLFTYSVLIKASHFISLLQKLDWRTHLCTLTWGIPTIIWLFILAGNVLFYEFISVIAGLNCGAQGRGSRQSCSQQLWRLAADDLRRRRWKRPNYFLRACITARRGGLRVRTLRQIQTRSYPWFSVAIGNSAFGQVVLITLLSASMTLNTLSIRFERLVMMGDDRRVRPIMKYCKIKKLRGSWICDLKILSASLPSLEPHLLGKFYLWCIQLLKLIRAKQIKFSHSPNTSSKVLFQLV